MARPPAKIRRNRQLNFSLTADELTVLRDRAQAAGMHLTDYGRDLLLRRRVFSTCHADPDAVAAHGALTHVARLLVHELRRLGNNLNQIARRLHGRDEPTPPTLDMLLREIRALLNRGARP